MNKLIISILALLFCIGFTNAQLFESKQFYPNVKTIKGKYYSGTGGGGYWSIAKLDTLGRTFEEESYRKKRLLSRNNFVYNSNNDKLYQIQTFDVNNPNRINDTIVRYQYKYQENRIIYKKIVYNSNNFTDLELIENKGDTILIYRSKSYYFRPKTNTTDVYEKIYTLKYKNELLIRSEEFDLDENSKENTYFYYYPNGMLQRRKIEREPEPEFGVVYVGGPGSDDMSYKYKFDKFGRIKKLYYIIGKKRYKIATYKYYKK